VIRPLTTVSLEGRWVALQPLAHAHVPDLVRAAAADRTTYDLTWVPDGTEETTAYVEELLDSYRAGEVLPFAQVDARTGAAVGCTRYLELRWPAGRTDPDELEIGGTWLGADAQRSGVNTEAKYLLLRHAFETYGVWRVAICTDEDNHRSRRAIERIGATFEGILRNHRLRAHTARPRPRNTAVYSIVREEWPDVRAGLEARMDR
jgi:RimJ/RimL family protein N-acetyltransferase